MAAQASPITGPRDLVAQGADASAANAPSDPIAEALGNSSADFGLQRATEWALAPATTGSAVFTDPAAQPTMQIQAIKRNPSLASTLTSSAQLTLWNFISNIRAQQEGLHFERTQTSAASIEYTLLAPATVPLPPSLWLLVMGGLGLAGSHLTLKRTGGFPAQSPGLAAA
jgi:hypothetical protein